MNKQTKQKTKSKIEEMKNNILNKNVDTGVHEDEHDFHKIQKVINRIEDENYFMLHAPGKYFNIQNVYPIRGKNHIETRIKNSKNQNDILINHVNELLHSYPKVVSFLRNNFKKEKPMPVGLVFNGRTLSPVIFVNRKSYYLIDFNALLNPGSPFKYK